MALEVPESQHHPEGQNIKILCYSLFVSPLLCGSLWLKSLNCTVFKKSNLIYFCIFGCAGSLLLHGLFSSCSTWAGGFLTAEPPGKPLNCTILSQLSAGKLRKIVSVTELVCGWGSSDLPEDNVMVTM